MKQQAIRINASVGFFVAIAADATTTKYIFFIIISFS